MESKNNNPMEEKLKNLRTMCQLKGLRLTPQRIEIYKYLLGTKEHPNAETIYEAIKEKIPNVSVDTVYRTLTSLEELDLIFRIDKQLPYARFDADKTPHGHFICTKCDKVYDIFSTDKNDFSQTFGAEKFGEVKDINIQVRGICNNCINPKL